MEGDIRRKRRIEGLISSWSIFTFWMFFFAVIGIVVAGWFTVRGSWWIWFVGGMMFIGALAETTRFIALRRGRRRRLESLIGSWSFFLFFMLLFYVIGIVVAQWWTYNDWWVWLVIGIFFFGSVTSTIRFFIYSEPKDATPADTYVAPETPPDAVVQMEKAPAAFCESCGAKVQGTEQFCANCGAPIR
jgi:hypothetical protein